MIISRTPLRVTLGGGGTDLPFFYKDNGGYCLSIAINKYMYVCINRSTIDNFVRLKYSKSEKVNNINELKHGIAREILKDYKIHSNIEIASLADVPGGTGLGSSSAYAVGLLKCLSEYKKISYNLNQIAEKACEIEITKLKKPIGKQDQYISALGGLREININKRGNVKCNDLKIGHNYLNDLKNNMFMFYTGNLRENSSILQNQKNKTKNKNSSIITIYKQIKSIGFKISKELKNGNIDKIGLLFDEHWELKKKLGKDISNKRYDEIYSCALENGALGGKISGAGGGGFFTFICLRNKDMFIKKMIQNGLEVMYYDFDFEGSKIIADFADYKYK